jgi:hypothetical protein
MVPLATAAAFESSRCDTLRGLWQLGESDHGKIKQISDLSIEAGSETCCCERGPWSAGVHCYLSHSSARLIVTDESLIPPEFLGRAAASAELALVVNFQ